MNDGHARCFSDARLNGLTLRNRLLEAATFEGKSPRGIPSESLIRFHERMGEGGVALTNVGCCAAEADGRISEDMLYMHEGIRPELRALIERVHATDCKDAGQLGHCGGFSKNRAL